MGVGKRAMESVMEPMGSKMKEGVPAVRTALVFCSDNNRAERLRRILAGDFNRIVTVEDADRGIWTVRRMAAVTEKVALCLFDVGVPEREIFSFIAFARGRGHLHDLSILVLTNGGDPEGRVRLLEAGADEVLSLPCPDRETVARIHSLLRRRSPSTDENLDAPARYEAGALVVDTDRHEVCWKGTRVSMTPIEFRILTRLARHPGKVFSREELMSSLWGEHWEVEDHNLSVHIHALRRKLSIDNAPCKVIETIRGIGYRLRDADLPEEGRDP